MFKSDFKFIAKYFQTKRKNKQYIPTTEEIEHVDSLLKMFIALTGDKHFESLYNEGNLKNKKGGVTMCDIVQGFVDEGIVKGRAEEKADMIRKMLETKFATEQQIADLLKISVKEVKKIAKKVPVEA